MHRCRILYPFIKRTAALPFARSNGKLNVPVKAFCTSMTSIEKKLSMIEAVPCSGCGQHLQFTDSEKLGYLPQDRLKNVSHVSEMSKLICQRCFQLRHNGKLSQVFLPAFVYENVVKDIRAKDMLVVQIVDMLDMEGSMLEKFRHLVGNKKVLLVLTKADLLPEKASTRRLLRYIKELVANKGVRNVLGYHLVSSTSQHGFGHVIKAIQEHREGRDVCVLGAANAGKSSFLNTLVSKIQSNAKMAKALPSGARMKQIMDVSSDEEINVVDGENNNNAEKVNNKDTLPNEIHGSEEELDAILAAQEAEEDDSSVPKEDSTVVKMTESPFPGTTLGLTPIDMPIQDAQKMGQIWDTPGLIVSNKRQKLMELLAAGGTSTLSSAIPTKRLPATIIRVTSDRSVFLGALARIDYVYKNEELHSKRRVLFSWNGVLPANLTKTENVDAYFVKHAGGLLSPPRGLDSISKLGPMAPIGNVAFKDFSPKGVYTKSLDSRKPKRTSIVDVVFPGFGWLTVSSVALDGTQKASDIADYGHLEIHGCPGVQAIPRACLFPYEISTSRVREWRK